MALGFAGKNVSVNCFPVIVFDCWDVICGPGVTSLTRGATGVPAINAPESASSISDMMRAMALWDLIFVSYEQGELERAV